MEEAASVGGLFVVREKALTHFNLAQSTVLPFEIGGGRLRVNAVGKPILRCYSSQRMRRGLVKMSNSWISRGLRHGDLHSLIDVASGLRPDGLTRDEADRLLARGFVSAYGKGLFRATLRGKLALWLRRRLRKAKAGG
jgi:hypothetical protein